MVNSRAKGCRHEREVAKQLSALMGLNCERGARNGVYGADDVIGWPGVHVECKVRKSIASVKWLEQSIRDAGDDLPVLVMRQDRGDNLLVIRADDLPWLCERYAKATGRPVYPDDP